MKKGLKFILTELSLISLALLCIICIFWVAYYLFFGAHAADVNRSRQEGLGFSKICEELNGQPFILSSIKKLNGYIDLNGRISPTQEDIDNYLEKEKNPSAFFHIYHQGWFQDHTWYCDINRNENNTINSTAIFHIKD